MGRLTALLVLVVAPACATAPPRCVVWAEPLAPAEAPVAEPTPACGPRFELVYELTPPDAPYERATIACADGAASVAVMRRSEGPADAEIAYEEEILPLDLDAYRELRAIAAVERDLSDCGPGEPGPMRVVDATASGRSMHGLCTAGTLDPRWSELVSAIERTLERARALDAATPREDVWPEDPWQAWEGEIRYGWAPHDERGETER